ncbi:glycosyl hydrolase [Consotaella aegiceratis]|uniref:glycosyl hydrolase n=1 Tax=Consotaella aegiceratis TaxID=3097961 RepID=UPI002F42D6AA
MPKSYKPTLSAFLVSLALGPCFAAQAQTPLTEAFTSPSHQAQPKVWWHWMDGNVSREGISKDLAWLGSVGIGGVTVFDGSYGLPTIVDKPVVYMSPEWKTDFQFALDKASERGMDVAIPTSPGWSQTGGPWVEPQEAMKKFVWSETRVDGGRTVDMELPRPPDAIGSFQDVVEDSAKRYGSFYRDETVFAYPVSETAQSERELVPQISTNATVQAGSGSNGAGLDVGMLTDGDVENGVVLRRAEKEPTWVELRFRKPITATGLTIAAGGEFGGWRDLDTGPVVRIEASLDGESFAPVARSFYGDVQRTIAFPATNGLVFRIFLEPQVKTQSKPLLGDELDISLRELVLRTRPTVNFFELKAGFGQINDFYDIPTPDTVGPAIARQDVVDLTDRFDRKTGRLNWTAPEGRWVIVRFGYGLTGRQNTPATEAATGLEVDKLNAAHVEKYVNTYLDKFRDVAGEKSGLRYLLSDSYEAGYQTWTEGLLKRFEDYRGYDPHRYLPALTGVVVDSPQASDRFLWDWRRTLEELLRDNHYGTIARVAHQRGLKTYMEGQEDRRGFFGDDMEMRMNADVPMGSARPFAPGEDGWATYQIDVKGASSVAHIYDRPIAAVEAFTFAQRSSLPRDLKRIADMCLLNGINQFVIHTSVHQPGDEGPGLSLGGIGHFFTRNETWAGMAKPWIDYLARASSMMQRGRYVADVAYFYGEEAPLTAIWGRYRQMTDAPEGVGFDFVNAHAITHALSVENGRLVSLSGTSYKVLQLGERSQWMTLDVLKKLSEFVKAGIVLSGDKPLGTPSLGDDADAFQRLATELWGDGRPGIRAYGEGWVISGRTINETLEIAGIARDWMSTKAVPDAAVGATHRRTADSDIYYLVNQRNSETKLDMSFRAAGSSVAFWDPVTGKQRAASYRVEGGRTIVPIDFGPMDSIFVVMHGQGEAAYQAPVPEIRVVAHISDAWTVAFQKDRGAPESIALPALDSLTEQTAPGIRYYSGVSSYSQSFTAPPTTPGDRTLIDLGEVHDIAEVFVNGESAGIAWRPPYRIDVTNLLKGGRNDLRVEVANGWRNRIIGDLREDDGTPVAFDPHTRLSAGDDLEPSGLLGPVRILETHE